MPDHKETLKQYINAFINDEADKAKELLASVLQSKMSEKIAAAKEDQPEVTDTSFELDADQDPVDPETE